MANEIMILKGKAMYNGAERVKALYVFPIVPRIQDAELNDVPTPFPYVDLMDETFRRKLPAAVLAAITAGDAGWVMRPLEKTGGESNGAFLTRAWADYDVIAAYAIADRRDQAVEGGTYETRWVQVER